MKFLNKINTLFNSENGQKSHPEHKKSISKVFKIDNEQYYEFDNLSDCPAGRYWRIQQFNVELNLRIDRDTLIDLLTASLEAINNGDITKSIIIQTDIKNRTNFLIETETAYRLASAVFFTLDEDLTTYDFDYNQKKIEKFKKERIDTFFLSRPMKKLLPQINMSGEDIALYLKMTEAQKVYESRLMHGN
jgi:hypothetical protein